MTFFGSSFGTPAPASNAFSAFSQTPAPAANPFNAFSTPAAAPAAGFGLNSGFGAGFKSSAPAAASTNFGFSSNAAAPSSNFGFGTAATSAWPSSNAFANPSSAASSNPFNVAAPASSNAFSTSAFTAAAPSAFSSGAFGGAFPTAASNSYATQQQQQHAMMVHQQQAWLQQQHMEAIQREKNQLKPNQRWNELAEAQKKQMMELDDFIQQQSLLRDEIGSHSSPLDSSPASSPSATDSSAPSLSSSISSIGASVSSLALLLNRELLLLDTFERSVADQYREAESAQRAVHRLQSHQSYHHPQMMMTEGGNIMGIGIGVGGMSTMMTQQVRSAAASAALQLNEPIRLPSPYHWTKLTEMVVSTRAISVQARCIDEFLHASASASQLPSPAALENVLAAQHSALLVVSSRIGSLHEAASDVRDRFEHIYGREGSRLIESERKKELSQRAVFDLNAPNQSQPIITAPAAVPLLAPVLAPVAAAAAVAPLGFGFPAPAAASSLGFGAPAAAAPSIFAPLAGFGAPAAAAPSMFAAPTLPASSSFGFGPPAAAAAPGQTAGFAGFSLTSSSSSPAQPAPLLGFGSALPTTIGAFGTVTPANPKIIRTKSSRGK